MIIFDLDGTLADCEHRRHFVDPRLSGFECVSHARIYGIDEATQRWVNLETGKRWKPDWKAFYEACEEDFIFTPVRSVLIQYCHREVEIWSGRCESVRKKTESWLSKNIFDDDFKKFKNIKLKMRPVGDSTPDDILKEKWLDEHIARGGRPIEFVFDDRPKVVRMWRRRGIFVFDVNQSGKEF